MPEITGKKRKNIFERDHNRCRYCGKPAEALDHVIPKSKGGGDDENNLVAACHECNRKKHDVMPANLGPDWKTRGRRSGRNFAPMPLAVLASDAPPRAKLLILALFHHDWDGYRAWPSQERLSKIMSVSRETVSEATKDCIARGWILVRRRFSNSSVYDLNIPDMNLEQFEAQLAGVQLSVFPTTANPDNTCQENQHQSTENPTLTENKRKEPITESKKQTPQAAKHPDQDAAWEGLKAVWTKKHPTAPPLAWPAGNMRGWQAALASELQRLGKDELTRRWANMVGDPWAKASLRAFIQDTDKWITAREQKGGTNARPFQQPEIKDWKTSGHRIQ